MQDVHAFADALEGFSRSDAFLGGGAPPSLRAAVRRLILDGSALPQEIIGIAAAVRALQDFERATFGDSQASDVIYFDPMFAQGPPRLEWAGTFGRIAQRIREGVEVGDAEAAGALRELLEQRPGKLTRTQIEQEIADRLGRTPPPATFEELWKRVPQERRNRGRPRKARPVVSQA